MTRFLKRIFSIYDLADLLHFNSRRLDRREVAQRSLHYREYASQLGGNRGDVCDSSNQGHAILNSINNAKRTNRGRLFFESLWWMALPIDCCEGYVAFAKRAHLNSKANLLINKKEKDWSWFHRAYGQFSLYVWGWL